jgi:hypothetical protein
MDHGQLQALGTRRRFLERCAGGIGMMALSHLLQRDGLAAENALARRDPHFPPKAKSVIFLFMAGAPSQLDLFEHKPSLQRLHGQSIPQSMREALVDEFKKNARIMGTPRTFRQFGQSGHTFSDLLPHLATCADELCFVRSLTTDITNHHPAQLMMNCGSLQFGRPSMGSWVVYGLGSESQDLPAFAVMTSSSGLGIEGGASNWSSGFLPSHYRGVTLRSQGDPVLHVSNPPGISRETQRLRLDALSDLNAAHRVETGDFEIESRIAAYELAFRMQAAVPELTDVSKEPAATLQEYGIDQAETRAFGTNCLLARRMVERGVRFVQLYHSSWDDHKDLNKNLTKNCGMIDRPMAALINDLRRRSLLDSTLVVWGGEFGRTPMTEVRLAAMEAGREGRDHHALAFTMWLAGGGVKPGVSFGETDEIGFDAVRDKVHVHDLQATILHCLGLNHEKLTYLHQGRRFRLTDVGGRVIRGILA